MSLEDTQGNKLLRTRATGCEGNMWIHRRSTPRNRGRAPRQTLQDRALEMGKTSRGGKDDILSRKHSLSEGTEFEGNKTSLETGQGPAAAGV